MRRKIRLRRASSFGGTHPFLSSPCNVCLSTYGEETSFTDELLAFYPPSHPAGMQALLEHSLENYRPLPSELRPRRVRSRTHSRPSPYPQNRTAKSTISPDHMRPSLINGDRSFASFNPLALQEIPFNSNVVSAAPTPKALKVSTPLVVKEIEPKRENAFGLAPNARPRVGSNARRTALGWSKRSNGKSSTDRKENIGQGILTT